MGLKTPRSTRTLIGGKRRLKRWIIGKGEALVRCLIGRQDRVGTLRMGRLEDVLCRSAVIYVLMLDSMQWFSARLTADQKWHGIY